MPSFNKVFLIGRLTKDPEIKYTAAGLAIATFTLAVDRKFKDADGNRKTDFLRCKAWRNKAEFVSSYFSKGLLVAAEGSIETSEKTEQDGSKRYFTDIVVEQVEILESRRERQQEGTDDGRIPEDDYDDSDPFAND